MTKYLLLLSLFLPGVLSAQTDSTFNRDLEEVVVSATKSEKPISALAMPVTVITKSKIEQMGSIRLNEILAEQTGLTLVYDHGTGVQMQGFSPEYTLILVDGEPLIGRTAGTLDLSRIAVGNIKQIEIVKGPSSSLYGSEALAGVVNIITDKAAKSGGQATVRYGRFNTVNSSLDLNLKQEKWALKLFGNQYSSKGYDLNAQSVGNTVSPFQTYTFMPKFQAEISPKIKLLISSRFYSESQKDIFDVGESEPNLVDSKGLVREFNLNPSIKFKISSKLKITTRFYQTSYHTESTQLYQSDKTVFDESFFTQHFQRPELQFDALLSEKDMLLGGLGMVLESVSATRYDDKKRFNTKYAFAQYEHYFSDAFHLNLGARYDAHSVYRNQFSPKISMLYKLSERWQVKGTFGYGYKAPDFRQLFLNFSNAIAGYSVFGSEELSKNLAHLEENNQLTAVLVDLSSLETIRPESSQAINVGFSHKTVQDIQVSANFFRNDIRDLIETFPAATKTNGQFVYSYRNLNKVFTQGMEWNASRTFSWPKKQKVTLSLGYQYLEAKDKSVLDKIEEGLVFRRNPETLNTERVSKKEYGGLMSRSKHMGNLKIFYSNAHGWSGNLRLVYRSKYGFGDLNGNSILDVEQEYIEGFFLLNLSAMKTWKKWRAQVGVDNVLNYTNAAYQPGLGGVKWYSSMTYSF
ncbi:TonB-dependent receptor [Marinilongibacter aquaticus]|uniref:TonB-dependent receptor plug domain-containing protein n=1 Tax=Marinilongibacter aquaticus TaxID=2975157 RepID=UPI0021BD4957|nr:TonB-dependent receptor [Marinilongibacter aquaticus]UBM60422.1 TonB-dependent receptor [Marinilongibacter aquaticus]